MAVLVTGAASGIGKQTALAFARRGASLAVCDVDESGLSAVAREISDLGGEVLTKRVDVGDRKDMEAFAADVHARFGALSILVNNAGVGLGGLFLDTTLEDWDWVTRINLLGVVHGCHFFLPAMIEAGARRARRERGVGGGLHAASGAVSICSDEVRRGRSVGSAARRDRAVRYRCDGRMSRLHRHPDRRDSALCVESSLNHVRSKEHGRSTGAWLPRPSVSHAAYDGRAAQTAPWRRSPSRRAHVLRDTVDARRDPLDESQACDSSAGNRSTAAAVSLELTTPCIALAAYVRGNRTRLLA